jgi:phage head maturation protease
MLDVQVVRVPALAGAGLSLVRQPPRREDGQRRSNTWQPQFS